MFQLIRKLFTKDDDMSWIGYEVSWTSTSYPVKTESHRDCRGRFTKGNQYAKLKKGKKKNGKK